MAGIVNKVYYYACSQTFRFTVNLVAALRNVDCFLRLPSISVGKAAVCFTSDGVLGDGLLYLLSVHWGERGA